MKRLSTMAGPCMEALLAWRTLDRLHSSSACRHQQLHQPLPGTRAPRAAHKDQAPNQTSTMASQSPAAAGEAPGCGAQRPAAARPPEWQACSHRLPQPPPAAPHAAALCLGDKCPPALSLQLHLLLRRLARAAVLAAGARCGHARHGGPCPRPSVLDVAQFAPTHHQHWLGLPGGGPAVHDRRRMLVPAAACAPARHAGGAAGSAAVGPRWHRPGAPGVVERLQPTRWEHHPAARGGPGPGR